MKNQQFFKTKTQQSYKLTPSGRHKKVYCFAMVLSHSRYKYVLWQERPFTTDTFIRAHIKAFAFLGGRPKEIVYDQDKILAVSENHGEIGRAHV